MKLNSYKLFSLLFRDKYICGYSFLIFDKSFLFILIVVFKYLEFKNRFFINSYDYLYIFNNLIFLITINLYIFLSLDKYCKDGI